VFDPNTVIDRATSAEPTRPAAGIEHVFVNGRSVWNDGKPSGERPGRALRRPQLQAETVVAESVKAATYPVKSSSPYFRRDDALNKPRSRILSLVYRCGSETKLFVAFSAVIALLIVLGRHRGLPSRASTNTPRN